MTYLIVGIVIWIACGVLAYGLEMACRWKAFPILQCESRWNDIRLDAALASAFCGPFALVASVIVYRFKHGLMFRKPEKWEE